MGDALYLQAPFVKDVERLGLAWAFTLKENQPELLREAERFTQASPAGVHTETGREIRYWHLPEVDWPVANRLVQVVKTVRIEQRRRVTIGEKDGQRTKSKTEAPTALVVLTMIRFLAYTLSLVFYHRQVRSHARGKCETFHECAKNRILELLSA